MEGNLNHSYLKAVLGKFLLGKVRLLTYTF